jgi:hypothetical protein
VVFHRTGASQWNLCPCPCSRQVCNTRKEDSSARRPCCRQFSTVRVSREIKRVKDFGRNHGLIIKEVTMPTVALRQWLKLPAGCPPENSANLPQSKSCLKYPKLQDWWRTEDLRLRRGQGKVIRAWVSKGSWDWHWPGARQSVLRDGDSH